MTAVSTAATYTASTRTAVRRVFGAGLVAAVTGSAVIYVYGTVVLAAHGPMRAGDLGAKQASPIHATDFVAGVVLCTVIATLIAVGIARFAADPALAFTRTALTLTAVSLAAPLSAVHTTEATRVLLACGHLTAAAVVIPVLRRGLSGRRSA